MSDNVKFAGARTEKSENSESRVALGKLTRPSDTVGMTTMLSGTLHLDSPFAQAPKRVLRVIIGCEFSGRVREEFAKRGHDAWSCDLIDSEIPGKHIKGDVLKILGDGWDIGIFHPPCTHTAVSGARHFAAKRADGRQQAAIDFFMALWNAPIEKLSIEQPVSIMSSVFRKPDQIIQPWQFGHGETKATCLWLRNLPLLVPTDIVPGRAPRVHHEPPAPDRWKKRSRTFMGVAKAMAEQWY